MGPFPLSRLKLYSLDGKWHILFSQRIPRTHRKDSCKQSQQSAWAEQHQVWGMSPALWASASCGLTLWQCQPEVSHGPIVSSCESMDQATERGIEAQSSGVKSNASWASQKQHLGSCFLTSLIFILFISKMGIIAKLSSYVHGKI